MKAVIQRVKRAAVSEVEIDVVTGQISEGLFVLVGVKKGDTEENTKTLAAKLKKIRLFEETEGKMTASVMDRKLPILLVSQFTLLADTSGGNRPSFIQAEEPSRARELYELLISELQKDIRVETGSFGKYMKIEVELDGPVTIVLEV